MAPADKLEKLRELAGQSLPGSAPRPACSMCGVVHPKHHACTPADDSYLPDGGVWYVDCFSRKSKPLGDRFPVNTYYSPVLSELVYPVVRMLASPTSGIDEVRISRTTLGMAPIAIAPACPRCACRGAEFRGEHCQACGWRLPRPPVERQSRAVTDGCDFREGHLRDNLDPDQLRDVIRGLADEIAALLPAARAFCAQHDAAKSVMADKACKPACPYPAAKAVVDRYQPPAIGGPT